MMLLGLLPGCVGRGDALAPVVTITEPQSSAVRAGSPLQIVGYAMDDVGVVSIKVDGAELLDAPALVGERGNKLINFGFRPRQVRAGLWRSQITVTDVDGRVTALTFPLTIDGSPPTVEITGVEGLEGGRSRVSIIVRDDDAVGRITVGPLAEGNELSFTPAAEVPYTFETTGDVNLNVADVAGNVTTYP